jgi:hypothetical protein
MLLIGILLSPLASLIISYDGDAAQHALIGQIILKNHAIPQQEPTAYTSDEKIFIAHEWLAEIFFGVASKYFGTHGIAILGAGLLCTCLFLVLRYIDHSNIPGYCLIILTTVLFFLLRFHFIARPHLFSWLLFLLLYTLISKLREKEISKSKFVFGLTTIFLAWVNLHGSFVFGLGCLFILLILPAFLKPSSQGIFSRTHAALIYAFILIMTLVNPFGINLHIHIWNFLIHGQEMRSFVDEFSHQKLDLIWYISSLIYLLSACFIALKRRKALYIEDLILLLILVALSILSNRISAYFFLLAPMILLPRTVLQNYQKGYSSQTFIFSTMICLSIYLGIFFPQFKVNFNDELLPTKATNFIKSKPDLFKGNMLNFYDWGGYLAYELYPTHKVYIHGLNDHYGLNLINEYIQLLIPGSNFGILLKKFDWIIFPNNTDLIIYLSSSKEWRLEYQDEISSIFTAIHSKEIRE